VAAVEALFLKKDDLDEALNYDIRQVHTSALQKSS
jgi:hypothetical protein